MVAPANKPTNVGPTFLTAAAILSGATALNTPISGGSWVLPLIEVVAVVWLVGVGGRLIRLPTAATAALQLAGLVVALTSLFTSSGIGGVLPNAAAVQEAGALLSGAWQQIVDTAPPAPATPELSFLIALAVGSAAFIADFLVAEARSPALVALPLLCLYSVPASIATTMLPWYSFVIPAVLYALLLAVTGHGDRKTRGRAAAGMAANGVVITALATVAALLVANSFTSIGTAGRLPHTNSGGRGAIGLSPFASLKGSLQQSNPVNVLTASGLPGPDYFRTVALTTWTPNQGWSLGALESDIPDVDGSLGTIASTSDHQVKVTPTGYDDRFLPILTGTTAVGGLTDSWNYDSNLDTVFRSDKVSPGPYVLTVDTTKPSATALAADTVVGGGPLTQTGSLAASVRATAHQVTDSAVSAFAKASALEQWFTNPANGFVYSLNVPSGNSGDALVDFLTNKQGFCEQYASAMAIMLRALDIPTRVVVGFTQGVKQADGSYLITSHDAHAWVEVNFVNNGWVRFDPTPAVGGQGGQQGFDDTTAAPTSTSSDATTAPTNVSQTTKIPDGDTSTAATPSIASTQVAVATSGGGSSDRALRSVLFTLLAIAVVVGLLMVPTAVRRRRRRRRLALAASGAAGAAAAAWAEIEDTAVDHGILPHSAESARVTANRLAKRAQLGDDDRTRIRELVIAAEREWYGVPVTAGPVGASPPEVRTGGSLQTAPTPAGGAGVSPTVSPTALLTLAAQRPVRPLDGADLLAGVRSVVSGLREHAPIRGIDRIVPNSLRRAAR